MKYFAKSGSFFNHVHNAAIDKLTMKAKLTLTFSGAVSSIAGNHTKPASQPPLERDVILPE